MCGSATGLDIVFLEKKNALMASINRLKQNITFFFFKKGISHI